jgi:hypothetical protein
MLIRSLPLAVLTLFGTYRVTNPDSSGLGYFHSVRFADVENDLCSKAETSFAQGLSFVFLEFV